ncbi:MAG: D-Ala-D-Ala carboxypeptidase family metallohydrolase [Bacteroidales bacterium]
MGKYFKLEELCKSKTAKKLGIDNTPETHERASILALIHNLLDPLRSAYGLPITVNSGYRCKELNSAVGGVYASQHTKGEAADITAGSPTENQRLFELVQQLELPFDQLIDERGYSWIHLSYVGVTNRKEVLHL